MSQVIVTVDDYKVARDRSKLQEDKIEREAEFDHWRIGDVVKRGEILRKIFLPVVAPVLAFWSFCMLAIGIAVGITAWIMRILAAVFDGKSDTK